MEAASTSGTLPLSPGGERSESGVGTTSVEEKSSGLKPGTPAGAQKVAMTASEMMIEYEQIEGLVSGDFFLSWSASYTTR